MLVCHCDNAYIRFNGESVLRKGHFLKLTDSILFEQVAKSSLFNSTHYIVLYPQNGDRIVLTRKFIIFNCNQHFGIFKP